MRLSRKRAHCSEAARWRPLYRTTQTFPHPLPAPRPPTAWRCREWPSRPEPGYRGVQRVPQVPAARTRRQTKVERETEIHGDGSSKPPFFSVGPTLGIAVVHRLRPRRFGGLLIALGFPHAVLASGPPSGSLWYT